MARKLVFYMGNVCSLRNDPNALKMTALHVYDGCYCLLALLLFLLGSRAGRIVCRCTVFLRRYIHRTTCEMQDT